MAKGSRRFEFGWLEVVGLIVVFAGGSVAVFTLGFFLGKGLQENQLAGDDRVARLTIETVEEREKAPEPAPEIESPAPAPTVGLNLAVRPAPGAPTAEERPAPRPTARPLRERPSPTAAAPIASVGLQARPTAVPDVEVRPTAAPIARRQATPIPRVRATPVPVPTARAETNRPMLGGARGTWSVQVNATKDARTARTIVQDLQRRGFTAYAVDVQLRGELWYRVRVGRFVTMKEATDAIGKLRDTGRYERSFLVEE